MPHPMQFSGVKLDHSRWRRWRNLALSCSPMAKSETVRYIERKHNIDCRIIHTFLRFAEHPISLTYIYKVSLYVCKLLIGTLSCICYCFECGMTMFKLGACHAGLTTLRHWLMRAHETHAATPSYDERSYVASASEQVLFGFKNKIS
jgi:hypothetical protein